MDNSSGVGVLDKAASVLSALEAGPATLAQLVAATHLARPTAHRLAVALEHHRLVARDMQGRFVLGPRLSELATAAGEDRLLAAAGLDPHGLIAFFRLLQAMPGSESPTALAWVSSHPQHGERIVALEALIPTLARAPAFAPAIDWAAVQAEVGPPKP